MFHHKQIKVFFSQLILVMNKIAVMKRNVPPFQVVQLMEGYTLHPTQKGWMKTYIPPKKVVDKNLVVNKTI